MGRSGNGGGGDGCYCDGGPFVAVAVSVSIITHQFTTVDASHRVVAAAHRLQAQLTGNVPLAFLAEDAQLRAFETVVMAQRDVVVGMEAADDGHANGDHDEDAYDERREYDVGTGGNTRKLLSFRRGQYIIAEMDGDGGSGGGVVIAGGRGAGSASAAMAFGRLPDGSRGWFEKAAVVSVGA